VVKKEMGELLLLLQLLRLQRLVKTQQEEKEQLRHRQLLPLLLRHQSR
jgi:hypothetical protein